MPSEKWRGNDLRQRAEDALEAIQAVKSYVKDVRRETYLTDRMMQSAVERELLTIAEACAKILDIDESIETRFPLVPWRKIRGLGNVIRHEYGRVDSAIIWDTITSDHLHALAKALDDL